VQALLFQDGGITALGANIFNMGMIGCFAGFVVYKHAGNLAGRKTAAALAAWLAVVLAACAASLQLAFSDVVSLEIVLPAMAGVHAVIGLVEAAVTVAVLAYVERSRPDLLNLEVV
jgi:cobalt/nickel transport system permease protein